MVSVPPLNDGLDELLAISAVHAARRRAYRYFRHQAHGAKTSYGYILRGKPIGPKDVHAVEAFVEKPDAATAARYIAEGYLWNSGTSCSAPTCCWRN
jgi:mannose-1-phosphate guanylyltransferase/mannose-6-phosphate isomerase